MPLADAIGLIERDYDRYCHTARSTGRTPLLSKGGGDGALIGAGGGVGDSTSGQLRDDVSSLMAKAAAGGNLSAEELTTLISTLQQKQNSARQTETRGG